MENTPENKAKFFALYWGQEIMRCKGYLSKFFINTSSFKELDKMQEDHYLKLKCLSSITEEEAIECINLRSNVHQAIKLENPTPSRITFSSEYKTSKRRRNHSYGVDFGEKFSIDQIDYLRSKGFALPWLGLSLYKLKEFGWIN